MTQQVLNVTYYLPLVVTSEASEWPALPPTCHSPVHGPSGICGG